jgi:glycosyltransferase involved in cell wall biosynthesis
MLQYHRLRGTWRELVDVYIALTEFARRKVIEGGLPEEKVLVKPNFVDWDPAARIGDGEYALFVGRLSPEKGIRTLLAAWDSSPDLPLLRIVGDGPLREDVERAVAANPRVQWLGRKASAEVQVLLRNARALLFPSEWYEGLPLVIIEAYAVGIPVIGSRIGAAASLIEPGRTGLHHVPGDSRDLVEQVRWAWKHPDEMRAMGANGRGRFEERYTSAINYRFLRTAYAHAGAHGQRRGPWLSPPPSFETQHA